ncbi:hypothetical protein [Nocardiopsis aegyptia]|uniref:Uncharacterized protein n=1 Tax=Nocardiopsis aegyptia TaxID=220378 RepID=A0A7Z0EL69_9ACTN|nr:hypothetical protein [Nocardiopsis aegyptia]NYJ34132.1 hypothetical protein [Nocardiopsis aegyptia]
MPSGPLTRADLPELHPIVRPRPVTPPDRLWSAEDWERIRHGLEAPTMEDRWVALVEDDRLHLHRSWTGYGMFEADFATKGTGRRIVGARGEGVPEDGADLHGLFLELLIVGPLLKQDARDLWRRFTALGGLSALGRTSTTGLPKL